MAKPDVTLDPSKGVVAQMAARIYAAYITRGAVKDGEEASWMQRSIREAVRIAKTVAASVESDDEPGSDQDLSAEEGRSAGPGSSAPSPGSPARSPAAEIAGKAAQDAAKHPDFDGIVEETLSEKPESSAGH